MSTEAYRSRSIKRARRSKREIATIEDAIVAALEREHPMTVRQVFYQLVGMAVIDKTEQEYKGTVVRLLTNLRRSRRVPFRWIADNTRWMRKPRTDSSLEDALIRTHEAYRRCVWDNQDVYVEVWLEKDALAGVLFRETSRWDVPLMVTRGYPSLSYLYEAADAICEEEKPVFLYYFGDYDPSGCDITRAVEDGIREFAPDTDITFERVAVTTKQIEELKLPTRPTKKTDSRSIGFEGESVEVDAIPPQRLRQLVEECIIQHVNVHAYHAMKQVEQEERATLGEMIENMQGDDPDEGEERSRG